MFKTRSSLERLLTFTGVSCFDRPVEETLLSTAMIGSSFSSKSVDQNAMDTSPQFLHQSVAN